MHRTRQPPPRRDVPGQEMLFSDCPPHPAGPRDGRGLPWWDVPAAGAEADARRTEALRKRDERREAKR